MDNLETLIILETLKEMADRDTRKIMEDIIREINSID